MFKMGDRVRIIKTEGSYEEALNHYGKIVYIVKEHNKYVVGVEHDVYNEGCHRCNGRCDYGHGWFYYSPETQLRRILPYPEDFEI